MFEFDDGMGMDSGFGGMRGGMGGGFGGRGAGREKPKPKVPVSILCGFLGAGKTTLVRHILQNREGLKVGLVINDVAEANIDSEVLAFEDADGIIGLQNGCACCSGRDDLFARLQELVDSEGVSKLGRGWDRLVVECSGVAEPESIAAELEAMGRRGDPLMKSVFLAGIICVVDASTFWDAYNAATAQASAASGNFKSELQGASGADAGEAERKPLSALLVNQLESSDMVIINKADLASPAELQRLTDLLKALCPTARHLTSTRGALPLRTLLPAEPISLDMPAYVPTVENRHGVAMSYAKTSAVPAAAPANTGYGGHGHGDGHGAVAAVGHGGHSHGDSSCKEEHGGGHAHGEHGHSHAHGHDPDCSQCAAQEPPAHAQYGLTSFVYRRSEPFCTAQLAAAARQLPVAVAELELPGIAAADPVPAPAFQGVLRSKGFVRVVGGEAPYYWSHAGRQLQLAVVTGATKSKGQELVFIGIGMDEAAIVKALDSCLQRADPESGKL